MLLFTRGETGSSWSIRDYSIPHSISIRYAREFPFTLSELRQGTSISLEAPTTSTSDLAFWHDFTCKTNEAHLQNGTTKLPQRQPVSDGASRYPLLDQERLYALPKAAKAADMRRILTSPNSEDWVTWNVFALIRQTDPDRWWQALVNLARKDNPAITLPVGWQQQPAVALWQCRTAPAAYENASRQRMQQSSHEPWIRRAKSIALVEGESEIDVSVRCPNITLYVEAKLGSDVSLATTYDPTRNQIIRNIDCLLEESGETTPLFWMLVRDIGTMRAYTQLMRQYRDNPASLEAALPHRNPVALRAVAANLAMIRWSELLTECCHEPIPDPFQAVWKELCRRVM